MARLRLLTYRRLYRLQQLLIVVTRYMSLCRSMSMLILSSCYMNISEHSSKLNSSPKCPSQVECK